MTIAVRRLLESVPVVLGVTLITFLLFHVFGGNPVHAFLGKHATPEEIAALEIELGLTKPLLLQYFDYLVQIATLDFGRSFVTREPVAKILLDGMGPSVSLTLPALLITTILSVSVALFAALVRGSKVDRAVAFAVVFGMSLSFLVYIVLGQYLLAFRFPLFQIHGYRSAWSERASYLALPILIMVVVGTGFDARLYRSVILEEMGKDYVTTAVAKGLSWSRILFVHVLKNAMVPIVTHVMISVPFLVTGSLLLESFFGIPGLGTVLLTALDHADFPVIKAYTVMVSLLFVVTNVATDLLYAWVDPRLRVPSLLRSSLPA